MYENPSHLQPEYGLAADGDPPQDRSGVSLTALATIVHDLRSPVLAMLGFGHILRDNDDPAERAQAADRLEMAGTHLLAIVSDILELSRIEAGRLDLLMGPVDSLRLFSDTISMVADMARAKGLDLCLDIGPTFPKTFLGDARRLRQILINLMSNAVKLTDRGSVRLQADLDLRSSALRISVVDTGPGLTSDQAERLFRPFQQTDPFRDRRLGGTGLGLAISRSLADAMGGSLCVISQRGEGATFSLALPFQSGAAPSDTFRPDCSAPTHIRTDRIRLPEGTRVLVADDDILMRDLAAAILSCLGAGVETVGSGEAALRIAREQHFDIVLLDHHLGDMDGIALAGHLRQQSGPSSSALLIGMTASVDPRDRDAALAAGMDAYVTKALTPVEIASLVAELNGLRLLASQAASANASR